ncbi:family 43 glycosylhydrolase [Microbacterium ureisolvens]|uniref:Family 43 glycosylhydrolase n=1 Tax=Microbacterium ureisolvens TaxID=2781186 RepID=A0ABS7HY91_9MICO|nr:family 43 glycosylhydrolase [Microbacterium ureisolvens]MBW9110351.1 family 43 glycosylhydrolase [Microbacterium ureisolvens]
MNRVVCNPVDLAYRYQDVRMPFGGRSVHREAADPTVVHYRGRYYMFASMTRGFWHSEDLVEWELQHSDRIPATDYAPDVREVDGALLFTASRRAKGRFFRSVNPLADDFQEVASSEIAFWDPATFQDDDGRLYLYWGCSHNQPIRGVELDRESLQQIGEAVPLIEADAAVRGWERPGDDYVPVVRRGIAGKIMDAYIGDSPFIEGAYLNRVAGRYHLQYAGPGTQYNTYADGSYTGTGPLGPFEYDQNSPFSSKPGGFITGAGHGSTFQDRHGNWWHVATMRISVNADFERRIGLFPAGFDDDGVLFCNQNFADFPMSIPDRAFDPWTEASPGWMLLSYRAEATASSFLAEHEPKLATDESVRTWWVAGSREHGEWLSIDLGAVMTVHALQVNLADHKLEQHAPKLRDLAKGTVSKRGIFPHSYPTEFRVEVSVDGAEWTLVHNTADAGEDRPHAFIVPPAPHEVRYVRVTAGAMPFGGPFALSGLRVFGHADVAKPAAVTPTATRPDARTAVLAWDAVPGAVGYNIRYGIAPEKLYHSWLVYDRTELEIGSLNADPTYWAAVDSFNEAGVTPGPIVRID